MFIELSTTCLVVDFKEKVLAIPNTLIATELGFFVQLARMATREFIKPLTVTAPIELPFQDEYTQFFGVKPKKGKQISLKFSSEDASRPFITENEQMWDFFEPNLRKRFSDIGSHEGMSNRVRDALLELLPSGQTSINEVAGKLAVSTRTLQRRLSGQGTSYQVVLSNVREELARHYIMNSELPYAQISFLLGYDNPNSFFRAFHT